MDSQLIVYYQICDIYGVRETGDYHEAVDYFQRGWLVFEVHKTVVKSEWSSSQQKVTIQWNDNPEFKHLLPNEENS
ncbi:MAG: hypothetical protein LBN39_07525 [Planctomycetaceae bacterium]|jgi:hypothetical protein|nr:hypothetical protein [Planctomycetaceae bacterium]